jgi:hypothetical protein
MNLKEVAREGFGNVAGLIIQRTAVHVGVRGLVNLEHLRIVHFKQMVSSM